MLERISRGREKNPGTALLKQCSFENSHCWPEAWLKPASSCSDMKFWPYPQEKKVIYVAKTTQISSQHDVLLVYI